MRNHSTSEVISCFLWISTSNTCTNHTFNLWTSLSCSYTVCSLGRRVLIKKTFHHFTLFISLYVSSELWDDKRAFNSRSQPSKEQLYIEYITAYMQIIFLYMKSMKSMWHTEWGDIRTVPGSSGWGWARPMTDAPSPPPCTPATSWHRPCWSHGECRPSWRRCPALYRECICPPLDRS